MGSSSSSSDSASSIGTFSLLSCSLHQLLIHLFSFLFTLSLITSFFTWRAITLLLNKVHSNLKLPLLTLTTNGSFLFLVLLSSLNLSLQTAPQRHALCIRLFHLLVPLFSISHTPNLHLGHPSLIFLLSLPLLSKLLGFPHLSTS
ncbi:unnamed protein product [Microthlaspi erraticum]|uniref:Uncharacterized protein n=1 Tax=Microthlaspi erraticum TaxID=1685480 RepID=A0A6D2JBD0_9BRAS|nr:unnamed protein product [Microthlaspi erraticum]